jgi:hypothetical protein
MSISQQDARGDGTADGVASGRNEAGGWSGGARATADGAFGGGNHAAGGAVLAAEPGEWDTVHGVYGVQGPEGGVHAQGERAATGSG